MKEFMKNCYKKYVFSHREEYKDLTEISVQTFTN